MFRFSSKFLKKKMGRVGGFYFQNTMVIGAAYQDPCHEGVVLFGVQINRNDTYLDFIH